jgi:hypothetical protein
MTMTESSNSAKRDLMIPLAPACDQQRALGWMGPPPLIPGEDPAAYQHVLAMVADALQPKDIVDWFRVRDVTDQQWEIIRLRPVKASLITQA